MLSAVLFDLDGTLLDSNDAHVRAWHAALRAHGYNVARDRIAVEIGKGGDKLVSDLLGREAETRDGDALRAAHDEAFSELARREGLLPTRGAKELVAAMRERGFRVALATSTQAAMLEVSERASGIAWRELFDAVVDADDVEESKPAPDIVASAAAKLGVTAAECAMFGDTPWDAHAARRAGVVLVGLRCGGNTDRALLQAGARVVYADPAAAAEARDELVHRVSPGAARLDAAMLAQLMQHALGAAEAGLAAGEVPIGAVLARGDGEVIARGWNRYCASGDPAAHGEVDAFRAAAGRIAPGARDTILVSTLEPCVMCLGAAMETAVDAVIYGLHAPEDCGTDRVQPPASAESQMPRIVGEIRPEACRALFETWLAKPGRDPRQERFVRALLAPRRA